MHGADALSRAPIEKPMQRDKFTEQEIVTHVSTITTNMPGTTQKLTEIKQQTAKDDTLQLLKTMRKQERHQTKAKYHTKVKQFLCLCQKVFNSIKWDWSLKK